MKKKLLLALIVAVLGVFAVGITTSAASLDDLTYEISNDEVTITGCSQSASGSLIIPDEIDGYPVTTIGAYAFSDCYSLTSITIPDSVTTIGAYSFSSSALTNITIPDSVMTIEDCAFYNCDSLTNITIPDNVTIINYGLFAYSSSLASVTIPNKVTSVGYGAFEGCSSLTDVYYKGSEEEWKSISFGSYNSRLTNANIIYMNNEPHITTTDVDIGEHPAKAWDVLIRAFDSAREYTAEFTDSEEVMRSKLNFDNIETNGDVAFAVLLRTLRKTVQLAVTYSR